MDAILTLRGSSKLLVCYGSVSRCCSAASMWLFGAVSFGHDWILCRAALEGKSCKSLVFRKNVPHGLCLDSCISAHVLPEQSFGWCACFVTSVFRLQSDHCERRRKPAKVHGR